MSEFEVSEEHLKRVADTVGHIQEHLKDEVAQMLDQKEDLFMRYMAYCRVICLCQIFITASQINKNMFRMGFDLKNDIFHTKQFKKKGWADDSLDTNPFFGGEDSDDDEEESDEECKPNGIAIKESDLPDEAKEFLANILIKELKKRKSK